MWSGTHIFVGFLQNNQCQMLVSVTEMLVSVTERRAWPMQRNENETALTARKQREEREESVAGEN